MMYVAHVMKRNVLDKMKSDEVLTYTEDMILHKHLMKNYYKFFNLIDMPKEDFTRVSWGFSSVITKGNLLKFHGSEEPDNVIVVCDVNDEDVLHHHAYYDYTDWVYCQEYPTEGIIAHPEYIEPVLKEQILCFDDDEVLFRLRKSQVKEIYDNYASFLQGKYAWCITKGDR